MGDNYKDYSRRPAHVDHSAHPDVAHESGGNTRGMPDEKNWQDSSTGELERAAQDNHDRPLGTLVGDWHVKEEDGQDDGLRYEPAASAASGAHDWFARSNNFAATTDDRCFVHELPRPNYPTQTFYRRCVLAGFQLASAIGTTLAFFLIVGLSLFTAGWHKVNPFHKGPPRARVEREYAERVSGERYSARAAYYAEYWGWRCEDVDVETEDGFVLRVHHLSDPKREKPGPPVILQHGILSNSVTFMVNEERSLAFWLLEQGYDVYCSNIRTNIRMPHRTWPRSDPRYWAWGVKDIAMYDLPAIVDYVGKKTGLKPAYIGHSQGCGTMYIALSRGVRPDLGNKLSCFISLAPAVYAGPCLRHFPFSLMRRFAKSRKVWSLVFGVREFIPAISLFQRYLPGWLFGHLANPVFAFIFGFHDHNWLKRQVPKFFRTVAVPNSSELLFYMSIFSYKNCVFDTTTTEPWFPPSMPPLAIFYGTLDTLVLGKPLVERIRSHEPHVRLVKAVALENYEHQDPIWAHTAIKEVYPGILEVLQQTAPPASARRKVERAY
ncbi:hypothetical protein Rhopal_005514-T1 [Rhodotorula paludigena]|uniref:Partial AB-hydrolase lipase domain-containing protein n=1 Tax=Rhodotorula paludigena TaxID=86838 RepID=A0AAV5GPR2_9BASI|nr:hypothetical protein Rhopal_005514-T1 [Rhodotorula paludigena]